jgi:hypothetical protein
MGALRQINISGWYYASTDRRAASAMKMLRATVPVDHPEQVGKEQRSTPTALSAGPPKGKTRAI